MFGKWFWRFSTLGVAVGFGSILLGNLLLLELSRILLLAVIGSVIMRKLDELSSHGQRRPRG